MSLKGLLLLGAVAFAAALPRGAEVLVELDQTPMGSALLSTVHLQLETETPVDDIVSILQEIADDLESQQKRDDGNYSEAMTHCKEMTAFYNGQIEDAKNEIKTQTANLDRDVPELKRVNGQITQKEDELKKHENDKKSAAQKRKEDNELFNERDAEYEDSVKACEEAVGILREMKYEQKSESKEVAVLQLRSIENRISKSMNEFQSSLYGPSIKALVQVAAGGDEVTVDYIIALIQELGDDLAKARGEDQVSENDAQKAWEEYDSDLAKAIEGTKSTLEGLREDKSDLEKAIEDAENALRNANDKKKSNEDLLKSLTESCGEKTRVYEKDRTDR